MVLLAIRGAKEESPMTSGFLLASARQYGHADAIKRWEEYTGKKGRAGDVGILAPYG